jgi:hypothetical protein
VISRRGEYRLKDVHFKYELAIQYRQLAAAKHEQQEREEGRMSTSTETQGHAHFNSTFVALNTAHGVPASLPLNSLPSRDAATNENSNMYAALADLPSECMMGKMADDNARDARYTHWYFSDDILGEIDR